MVWKVRGIRGATTVAENSKIAIAEAVTELLDEIETHNKFECEDIITVFFSVTRDLDAVFPAAIARTRPGWNFVPLIDLQHMNVAGSLERCIRILIQVNSAAPQSEMIHCYLRKAKNLRPDLEIVDIIK